MKPQLFLFFFTTQSSKRSNVAQMAVIIFFVFLSKQNVRPSASFDLLWRLPEEESGTTITHMFGRLELLGHQVQPGFFTSFIRIFRWFWRCHQQSALSWLALFSIKRLLLFKQALRVKIILEVSYRVKVLHEVILILNEITLSMHVVEVSTYCFRGKVLILLGTYKFPFHNSKNMENYIALKSTLQVFRWNL